MFHPAAVGVDGRVNLFVGNLPYRVRWQDVKDLFRRAGTVLRADVALDPQSNRSRGHGSVLMGSQEDGIKAIEMFNGYAWQTRVLEVRPDRLPPEYEPHPYIPPSSYGNAMLGRGAGGAPPNMTGMGMGMGGMNSGVGVAGGRLSSTLLPFNASWQELKDLFRTAGGNVVRADIALGPDGRSKGFGNVLFQNEEDAAVAVQAFDG
ncbi:hypothetical protein FFLO_00601 [Filobasidium floriforme]|uniref:RRM domain-containing protein n=1 Tax=Filobasidium floriforme TaxID=5210 RepID=A0A8K0NT69_9TREE|nr:hypothetical protein FFLO_00601 [Filobasidium floriforme]